MDDKNRGRRLRLLTLVFCAESQLIGVIMAWTILNDMSIDEGLAIQERASQLHSQEKGLFELQKFLEIFDAYPGQM